MKHSKSSPIWALAVVASLGMGLSACGGGGSSEAPPPVVDPEPTPYETAKAAIAAATTPAAAQAAYDAVSNLSDTDAAKLRVALDQRLAQLNEPVALKTAQDAAKTAYLAARDAFAGLTGMQAYNPVAYTKAQNALNDAKAANDAAQAATTSDEAERHQAAAEAANTAAMGFAQEVQEARTARMADAPALMAAQDAAETAYQAARAAFVGLTGMQAYNPVAYAKAQNALNDAKAAYDAAKAATTSDEAERHQAAAEAANTAAMGFAQEVLDVPAARMAATAAAKAAKAAYDAAMAALAEVEANKADDMDSYETAKAKVDAAKAAYDAAKAASDEANTATTKATAETAKDTAEAEKAKAEAARDEAVKYAGMVTDSFDTAEGHRTDLRTAQMAASSAAEAAMTARDEAQTAVDGLETKKADDVPNHTRAMDALDKAKAAYNAAKAASDAAEAAMATAEGVAEAQKQQGIAVAKREEAETAKAEVVRLAGLVDASYQAAERERQKTADETTKLATAKTKAMEAATAARTAATKARMAANEAVEALGATSMLAIEAGKVADAAEAAATAAELASTNAQADTASADAEAEQKKAESKKREAEMKLAEAQSLKRDALLAQENTDRTLIVTYREQAMDAKDEARAAATKAREYATKADMAADAAEAAAADAKRKRTDYAEANKKAMAARAAATAAEAAAVAAEAAATAAEAESEKATAEGVSVEDALAARDMARAKRSEAVKQRDTAMAKYDSDDEDAMGAKQLAAAAVKAGGSDTMPGTYALELFKVASGQGLADAEKKARITLVRDLIEDAGDEERDTHVTVGEAKAFTPNANGTGTADNSVDGLWQYNTNDNDQIGNNAYGARIEHKIGKDRVYRFGKYTAEHLRTPEPEVTTAQATQRDLPMLGGFTGVELTQGTRAVHIYTDYDTSKRKAATKAGTLTAAPASSGTFSGAGFGTPTATSITVTGDTNTFTVGGVAYTLAAGADALTCAANADCSSRIVGGEIVSLGSGWKVNGSATAAGEMGDPDYMTFGYWLDLGGSAANNQDERLGAFASGNAFSSTIADGVITALTGNATYRGSAAGLHGMTGAKEAVQPFDAKAELTAKFGTAAELGTVEGRIYDINSGGERLTGELSEVILSKGDVNSATSRSFTYYDTRMGTPTVDPTDSSAEYPMNGFWHGRFSEAMAENADAAKKYPTSVIGTFGVSGTLDMGTADNTKDDVTHSLIGAFGTHLEQ